MKLLPVFDTNISLYFFCFFLFVALIQFLYLILIFLRFALFKPKKNKKESHHLKPITILIASRNESDNLAHFLPLILEQNYPEFEVIVINNQSVDDSYYILNKLKERYSNLKVVELERSRHLGVGKKLPITMGVKAAKYDQIVVTDADCSPASANWLQYIGNAFARGEDIVLGFGPLESKKTMLNKLIRFDVIFIAMNYFSFALSKLPYMGVGRNLAYTKKAFNSVHGFKSHYAIASGDDDLFVQEAAVKNGCGIMIHKDSFCYSNPKNTWREWVGQKHRHYTTASNYNVIKKLLLGIYPATLIFMWFSFVYLMFDVDYRWLTLAIFLFVISNKWIIQGKCLLKLKGKSFITFLPVWDLFYALLMPFIYYTTDKRNVTRWK